MNQDEQNTFYNYREGNRSKETEKRFAKLFRNRRNESELKRKMWEDWHSISDEDVKGIDLSPILHKINYIINSEKQTGYKDRPLHKLWNWYSRLAAVSLLPVLILGCAYLLLNQTVQTEPSLVKVVAPMGSRINTQLPDGSSCWLNSGTTLKYEIPFKKRHISLEGEAFFDVKENASEPFRVEGKHSSVRVMGTRFNVEMWPDEDMTEVVLEKGQVELMPNYTNQTFNMKPGEKLIYNSKKRIVQRDEVNPEYYSAWIDGKLILREENIQQMARELERWFNIEVIIKGEEIKDYSFRATFENERLEEVLHLLKRSSPIEYEIINNKRKSNNTFTKKKVIIRHE
jgi:ferric-dicitrate binding protein FerR (iron transport regulator)